MACGVVHLPVYATGFRGDDVEAALQQLAPLSVNYGATRYDVYRSRDDRYRFLHVDRVRRQGAVGARSGTARSSPTGAAACSSWYTVPLLYVWNDNVSSRHAARRRGRPARRRARLTEPTLIAGFLSADECRAVIAEIDGAHQEQAQIWRGEDFAVHAESRLGRIAALSPDTEVFVQDRLWEVIEQLEARFDCEVSHLSGVTALIYRVGDHFAAHSDGGGDDDAPFEVRRRKVSLVVALNHGDGGAKAEFAGGELEFYAGDVPEVATRAAPVGEHPLHPRHPDRLRLLDDPPRRPGHERRALLARPVGPRAHRLTFARHLSQSRAVS